MLIGQDLCEGPRLRKSICLYQRQAGPSGYRKQVTGASCPPLLCSPHTNALRRRYTAFTLISMAAGVSVAFPALWLASYAWNTRAAGGPLQPRHGRSWPVRPAAVCCQPCTLQDNSARVHRRP